MTESRTEYQVKDADKSVTQLMEEILNLTNAKNAADVISNDAEARIRKLDLEIYTRMFQE